jgi:ubiquinone/menaquinone biosynthesis C-methylase UbiE
MRREAVKYWNTIAHGGDGDARDAVLAGFRSERSFDEAGREDAAHLVLPFVSATDTVMEVGCGLGRILKWVAPMCRRAIGLDVSSEMLAKARARLGGIPNITLKRLPLTLQIPLPSQSIDFAYFYHVSEHMDREDAFTVLTETRRCLRTSGKALVQFSLISHPDNQREFIKWARAGDPEGVRSRFYTETEAAALLEMVKLFPQMRFYIPGEFAVLVVKKDKRELGQMPLVKLPAIDRAIRASRNGPTNKPIPGGR